MHTVIIRNIYYSVEQGHRGLRGIPVRSDFRNSRIPAVTAEVLEHCVDMDAYVNMI